MFLLEFHIIAAVLHAASARRPISLERGTALAQQPGHLHVDGDFNAADTCNLYMPGSEAFIMGSCVCNGAPRKFHEKDCDAPATPDTGCSCAGGTNFMLMPEGLDCPVLAAVRNDEECEKAAAALNETVIVVGGEGEGEEIMDNYACYRYVSGKGVVWGRRWAAGSSEHQHICRRGEYVKETAADAQVGNCNPLDSAEECKAVGHLLTANDPEVTHKFQIDSDPFEPNETFAEWTCFVSGFDNVNAAVSKEVRWSNTAWLGGAMDKVCRSNADAEIAKEAFNVLDTAYTSREDKAAAVRRLAATDGIGARATSRFTDLVANAPQGSLVAETAAIALGSYLSAACTARFCNHKHPKYCRTITLENINRSRILNSMSDIMTFTEQGTVEGRFAAMHLVRLGIEEQKKISDKMRAEANAAQKAVEREKKSVEAALEKAEESQAQTELERKKVDQTNEDLYIQMNRTVVETINADSHLDDLKQSQVDLRDEEKSAEAAKLDAKLKALALKVSEQSTVENLAASKRNFTIAMSLLVAFVSAAIPLCIGCAASYYRSHHKHADDHQADPSLQRLSAFVRRSQVEGNVDEAASSG